MDDRRFDSLTKALASGASRRSVFKGLLGLGAVAVTGAVVLDDDGAEAATRPTPTPKPPTCPGVQTWNSTLKKCVCPANLSQCVPGVGPACCNDKAVAPGAPGYSTCCDNACCQGTCYAEELCCATNTRTGGLSPTNRICNSASGTECCLFSDECCKIDGCCATTCFGGNDGESFCCPAGDWCPGGSTSPELCCEGDTVCCGANTNGNICTDLSDDDNNCGACGNVCGGCSSCQNGVCVADDDKCEGTDVCCPKEGTFTCETGPFCGCDVDSDCPSCNRCNEGTCEPLCNVESQVCCANLGTHGLCVSNVDGVGCCTSDDCTNTGADECLVGTCGATGVCGYTPNNLLCGPDCGVCSEAGVCSDNQGACDACETCLDGTCGNDCTTGQQCCQLAPPVGDVCIPAGETCCDSPEDCFADCEVCNDALHYCVSHCTGTDKCCPGTDNCVPADATCCDDDTDCTSLNHCADGVDHRFTCSAEGFCVDSPLICLPFDACTPGACNAAGTGCNTVGACESLSEVCCDAQCVDTSSDPNNCGTCGTICDTLACEDCVDGVCADICPEGTHCNGEGECIPDCVPIDGICSEDLDCCDDDCCNGVCKVPDNSTCVINADCCVAGGSCCREVGGGLECKPGLGQCHCDSDADCAVIPGGLVCNLESNTCEHPA